MVNIVFSESILSQQAQDWINNTSVAFEENMGQLADDQNKPIPFVLFKASVKGMDLYITEKGLTYVFLKAEEEQRNREEFMLESNYSTEHLKDEKNRKIEYCRVDMSLEGANIKKENVILEYPQVTDFNYYLSHCPNGIMNIKRYAKITITNIYQGIDWVWYPQKEKGLKYDFIVHPGANPNDIKMFYHWADVSSTNSNKELLIRTPVGELKEGKAISYCDGKEISTNYQVTNNLVTFQLGTFNSSKVLIIDPPLALVWGTYYGGNDHDNLNDIAVDKDDNIFITGHSLSLDFPTKNAGGGAYFQGTHAGWGAMIITKFNNIGIQLWSTFYDGGFGSSIDTDENGNVFITGSAYGTFPTQNSYGGTYFQETHAGGDWDAFILKFNTNGVRQWATYYGGDFDDRGSAITTDDNGNVFVTGTTKSSNFPTQNSGDGAYFQGTKAVAGAWWEEDLFILKFNTNGVRQWATYYGGSYYDRIGNNSLSVDGNGNLFIAGWTYSSDFPTQNLGGGAYFQGTNAGGSNGDLFILNFNNTGVRLWSTFYGGSGTDNETSIASDKKGNIFIVCQTHSFNMPTQNPGGGAYFQPTISGIWYDIFIIKFSNNGVRQWATYYGGTQDDGTYGTTVTIDNNGNVFIGGMSGSSDFPTQNPGGGAYFDNVSSGLNDAFFLAFDNNCIRLWSTFNGAPFGGWEWVSSLDVDNNGNLFAIGRWQGNGSSGLLDPGNGSYYQNTSTGFYHDGFIMKFSGFLNTYITQTDASCNGQCMGIATVNAGGGTPPYNYQWSNNQTTQTTIGLCPGIYTVTVTDSAGAVNTNTITITLPAKGNCETEIELPNVFTPNNDGSNDSFIPVKYESVSKATLKIFNRWGMELFYTDNPQLGWNGYYNGNVCLDGIYYWIIQYNTVTDESKELKGFLTLIK